MSGLEHDRNIANVVLWSQNFQHHSMTKWCGRAVRALVLLHRPPGVGFAHPLVHACARGVNDCGY